MSKDELDRWLDEHIEIVGGIIQPSKKMKEQIKKKLKEGLITDGGKNE